MDFTPWAAASTLGGCTPSAVTLISQKALPAPVKIWDASQPARVVLPCSDRHTPGAGSDGLAGTTGAQLISCFEGKQN